MAEPVRIKDFLGERLRRGRPRPRRRRHPQLLGGHAARRPAPPAVAPKPGAAPPRADRRGSPPGRRRGPQRRPSSGPWEKGSCPGGDRFQTFPGAGQPSEAPAAGRRRSRYGAWPISRVRLSIVQISLALRIGTSRPHQSHHDTRIVLGLSTRANGGTLRRRYAVKARPAPADARYSARRLGRKKTRGRRRRPP